MNIVTEEYIMNDDSMNPIIEKGSRLILNVSNEVDNMDLNNTIVLVDSEEDGIMCRKLYFSEDRKIILLIPLNYKYRPKAFTQEEVENQVAVIGKVIEVITKVE